MHIFISQWQRRLQGQLKKVRHCAPSRSERHSHYTIAATKVGNFAKAHGALIGKVGLKAMSTAEEAASKVVTKVPGYGEVVGKVMEVEGKVLSKVSNKISVKTSKKVDDAMKGMDKAQDIMEYVP